MSSTSDSEAAVRAKVMFAKLVALVPQDVLKEQIRASIVQDNEEMKDKVPFSKKKADKEIVRLKIDSGVPDKLRKEITENFKRIFGDKTFAQPEVENLTTKEEINKIVESVAQDLVRAWSIVLMSAIHEVGKNESVRLDDIFLPAMSPSIFFIDSEETFLDYITRMVVQDIGAEQAKIVYLAFKDKVKEEVGKRICDCGLEVRTDLVIKKDENGYFVCRKV